MDHYSTMALNCVGPSIHGFIFSINIQLALCNSGFRILRFNLEEKPVFCTWHWESSDVKGQLCSLSYVILYKELEHLQILVSAGGWGVVGGSAPETNLRRY